MTWNGAGPASLGVTAAAVGQRSFSPNGDRSKDAIRIDWTNARTLDRLVLRVYRANGTLVGEVPVRQLAAGHLGIVGGRRVPNGRYLVTLVGRAGGTTLYNPAFGFQAASLALHGVTVDTVAPTVRSASITSGVLSPNGDGTRESVKVSFVTAGATGWAFGVAPVSGSHVGTPVLIRSGGGGTANVTWTGRTSTGAVVPGSRPGRCRGRRRQPGQPDVDRPGRPHAAGDRADRAAGLLPERRRQRRAWPGLRRAGHRDGRRVSRLEARSLWKITKAAASGAVSWSGTDAAGRRVADGTYTFRVTGRDAAGNAATRTTPVRVDRTLGSVGWASAAFYPNDGDAGGDGPDVVPPGPDGDGQRRRLLADDARPDDLDEFGASGRGPTRGRGTAGNSGAFAGPGTYTLRVIARSGLGRRC